MIDERVMLAVLQSFTGSFLLRRSPGQVIPLAGISPDDFAVTRWAALGLSAEDVSELTRKLAGMFPPPASQDCALECAGTPLESVKQVLQGWQQGERLVVYKSSGSSGKPKRLCQSYESVQQEVDTLAALFPGIRTVIAATPQYHCYGFIFGVLLPKRLGAVRLALPPLPTVISGALAPDTLVVGYPDLWARLQPQAKANGSGAVCLSAGSPWPDGDMQRILDFGLNALEIYGSSENGAVGYRRGPGEFTLIDYWSRIVLEDGKEALERRLPSGELLRCPVQDSLNWTGERTFRPLKRLDSAVQVSGMNVYPSRVAAFIAEHPLVTECRVRLMRPQEGRRLKAFVVANVDVESRALIKDLKLLCKNGLSTPERPVSFTIGVRLPVNEFGKDADWEI